MPSGYCIGRFHGKVYILLPTPPEISLWEFKKTGNGTELEASETLPSPLPDPQHTHPFFCADLSEEEEPSLGGGAQ